MLSKEQLKEYRELAEIQTRDPLPTALGEAVISLLDELERVRKLHTEEQQRSADRLKECREQSGQAVRYKFELKATPFGSQVQGR